METKEKNIVDELRIDNIGNSNMVDYSDGDVVVLDNLKDLPNSLAVKSDSYIFIRKY